MLPGRATRGADCGRRAPATRAGSAAAIADIANAAMERGARTRMDDRHNRPRSAPAARRVLPLVADAGSGGDAAPHRAAAGQGACAARKAGSP